MSINQFPGGIVTKTPAAPTTSSAKGIWTLSQATGYAKQGIWPRIPGAPTIGTATAGAAVCASVTFTAPTCVGAGSLTYSVVSTPGCISNTGASSPIVVSGLTGGTSYTFKVYGVTPGGTGPGSAASNSITAAFPSGSQSYTTAGTYSWVVPTGVTSVSVVAVGGGGGGQSGFYNNCAGSYIGGAGGGGGGLGYKNNITVTPGNSITVVVGAAGTTSVTGGTSYFSATSVVRGGGGSSPSPNSETYSPISGGTYTGDGGGNGGTGGAEGGSAPGGGGGGAGGYSGNGGRGQGRCGVTRTAGSGGGGGGGAHSTTTPGAGGGVGILGQGSNGCISNIGGGGGSSGTSGTSPGGRVAGVGGAYGGGGSGTANGSGGCSYGTQYPGGAGGVGAVRIIWPGTTRSFPSTNTSSP